jgi:enamine deaminase RidA (YjgF/YER057c/UK114 family)
MISRPQGLFQLIPSLYTTPGGNTSVERFSCQPIVVVIESDLGENKQSAPPAEKGSAMRILLFAGFILMHGHALRAAEPVSIEPDRATGSSRAVVVGDVALAHTAQMLPPTGESKADVQVEKVLGNLHAALKKADSSLDRAVKLNFYIARDDVVPVVEKALARRFKDRSKPAVSFVTGTLSQMGALVSADAIAVSALPVTAGRAKKVQAAQGASVAVLPPGPVVYISGQAEKGATLAEATRKTLASLRSTLRFLSLDLPQVVQVKSFVHPMTKLDEVRREITAVFGKDSVPPLVFVEWQARDSIEIELIAASGPPKVKPADAVEYLTPPGMKASPIYSRVCRINHGKRVYVSGLSGEGKDGAAEVKAVFASLGDILKKAGSDYRHLVKATYYVATDDASRQLNALRPNYYDPKRPPAASKAAVAGTGRKGRGITLDMIAVAGP